MKKRLLSGLVVAALAVSSAAVAGDGLEISGNVDVIAGYQKDNSNAIGGLGGLTQGDFGVAAAPSADHVRFLLDQVEIDLAKEFGENIRLRADIDVRDLANTGDRAGGAALDVEQGYVTANISVGNGMEFLIGKFNSPIGLESVDRNSNVFTTFTQGYIYLIPTNVIGAKIYYAFNDNWSFDLAIVNSINSGTLASNSALPTGLLRVGVTWGEEGRESFVHLGGAVGPESSAVNGGGSNNAHLDMFGNLWANFALGDNWDWALEGTYRQSNNVTAGATNQKAIAGQTYFNYKISDVWDAHIRYGFFWEVNPGAGTGASTTGGTWSAFEGSSHSGTLGFSYMIADGAKIKFDYRFDMGMRGAGATDPNYHTGTAEFAYSF